MSISATLKKAPLPKIKCQTCDGSGEVEIPKPLFETLEILKKLGRGTTWDIHKHRDFKDNIGPTAVNNRMDDLMKLGLVERIRQGRGWLYWAK